MRGGGSGCRLGLWRCRSAGGEEGFSRQFSRSQGWLDWVGGEKGCTYGGSGGPDAVEHVGSEGDGDEEVFRVADAHYVARFVLREPICAGVHAKGDFFSTIRFVSLCLICRDWHYTHVHFTVRHFVFSTR